MRETEETKGTPAPTPRYTWPWFVLAGLILAILLAVMWMSIEVRRMRQIRDLNAPSQPAPSSNSAPTQR
jgi:hypothetical protein